MQSIEYATTVGTAIEIIPKNIVRNGIAHVQEKSLLIPNPVVVSIKLGGDRMALDLHKPAPGIVVPLTEMEMKHKDKDGVWQKIPRLVSLPDINTLIDFRTETVRDLIFAEAVVEGEDTIKEAKKAVVNQFNEFNSNKEKHYPIPNFHTIALVSKINGEPTIDDFNYAFEISKLIYIAGYGCDDGEKGRKLDNIVGRLADGFDYTPPGPPFGPPYYTQNF
ncbi:hypothetical protein KBD75_00645 [Candidatus Woesebacteria bacterium]|nr:hypothetical protein [Candidatus Woesebacteria bacterium]